MFRRRREASKADVISAAVDDARAQDELAALTCEAVAFICEVADKARAIDEALPREYLVVRHEGHLALVQNIANTNQWLDDRVEGNEIYVGDVRDGDVTLVDTKFFIEDVSAGLLNDVGNFIIERSRRNRDRVQAMKEAVEDVKALRTILDDENAW